MGRVTVRHRLVAVDTADGSRVQRMDALAGEEPLELRANGEAITLTMRTPGHDLELLHGFLYTEGVLTGLSDVATARYCDGAVVDAEDGSLRNTYNVMDVALSPAATGRLPGAIRNFTTTSSCGVCGQASIEALQAKLPGPISSDLVVDADVVATLPERLRAAQQVFARTGGLHAAALYDPLADTLVVREDVGRHNAADKVIGHALLAERLPAQDQVLVLSGRISFELVQKAAMAQIPVVVAVSAPSSLAVQLADELGITLAGFVRDGRMNLYSGADRVRTTVGR
ncbi:formate dehydrogenase accessory sulfurtransferase FdhD [Propionibacteriaceae bacterium Y2011]|uniref:formate dehydrogenase accessory sulfurtransferase FdhD n=1 Tax=Microlunatus sp. Y2014 TaxID=3418488 RepID=UPI003B45685E